MEDHTRMPNGLRRLIGMPTYADKLRMFGVVHDRGPNSEEELEACILEMARQLYNAKQNE